MSLIKSFPKYYKSYIARPSAGMHSEAPKIELTSQKPKKKPCGSQSQQRLHKSQFLQKVGCQKPCWDQAGLFSLVNKQVALKCA